MTYALPLRTPVLCDGQPGVITGRAYGAELYDVRLASGEVRPNVTTDRLRPASVRRVE